jgi:hypothetical protein
MVHIRHKFNRKVATTVEFEDELTKVYYHSTPVVSFNPEKIILDSGGWHTSTTKKRMNQVSDEFNLDFKVWQKDYSWYVDYKGKTLPFQSGMELKR